MWFEIGQIKCFIKLVDTNFYVEDILLNLETKGKYVINFNDEKL